MKKRGLSGIVATVLIILISIVAIFIVWLFVQPEIRDSLKKISVESLSVELEIVENSVVVNEDIKDVSFNVKRNAVPGNISGIRVVLEDADSASDTFDLDLMINELETKRIAIDYSRSSINGIAAIVIAPIFKTGDEITIGNIADRQEVTEDGGSGLPECSDRMDNADPEDTLIDAEDPGCHSDGNPNNPDSYQPQDNDETDNGAGTNHFQHLFDSDGYLRELNWSSNRVNWKRISFSEEGNPVWRKIYLHSRKGGGTDNLDEGWRYIIGSGWPIPPQGYTSERHSAINYTKTFDDGETVKIEAASATLDVKDTIYFSGDEMKIQTTIKNKLAQSIIVKMPVYLGGLQFNDNSRYKLEARKGGQIKQYTSDTLNSASYPAEIISYSPVSVVWDNSFTLGHQYLTELRLPTYVEFIEQINDFSSERVGSLITAEISPGNSRTFIIAYNLADSGDWQSSLRPYKDWFDLHYGDTPEYCPSGPFAFINLRNSNLYNITDNRWLNGSTAGSFVTPNVFDNINKTELENFGIWGTMIHNSHVNLNPSCPDCEYNPTTNLIDPNLDIGANSSLIAGFAKRFADAGIKNLIWYQAPSWNIYGANINLHPVPADEHYSTWTEGQDYDFVRGTFAKDIDLRDTSNRDMQYSRAAYFISKNATGVYFDAMSNAPGDEEFIEYVKQQSINDYGKTPFVLKEGGRDRDALKWPQALVLNSGDTGHSMLAFWLAPDASYYEGKFGGGHLTDAEIDEIIQMGYQPVLSNSLKTNDVNLINRWKTWSCGAYNNRLERWDNYGNSIADCLRPIEPSYCL